MASVGALRTFGAPAPLTLVVRLRTMSFETIFQIWLEDSFSHGLPPEVKAISFNLFEPASFKIKRFGIEIIGAGSFDSKNSDWACDEVWQPEQRQLEIPADYSGADWGACLSRMTYLVEKNLASNTAISSTLKSTQGVGIGFTDGELVLLWQA